MADAGADQAERKKRTFKKFTYRGVDLEQLLDLPHDRLMDLMRARVRRHYARGLKRKEQTLQNKVRKAKRECAQYEKPKVVKTHLRNAVIVPDMIGGIIGVYNGKEFSQVEIS